MATREGENEQERRVDEREEKEELGVEKVFNSSDEMKSKLRSKRMNGNELEKRRKKHKIRHPVW